MYFENGKNYKWLKALSKRITAGGIMHKSLYAAIAVFKRIKLQYCVEPKQRQVQEHITLHPGVLCPVAHDKRRDLKVFQSMQILSLCWGERTLHNLSSFSTR